MYFLQKKHKQKPLQTRKKTGQKRLFQTKKSKTVKNLGVFEFVFLYKIIFFIRV
jgi:hypothetical protein